MVRLRLPLAAAAVAALVAIGAGLALAATIVVSPGKPRGWMPLHSSCGGEPTGSTALVAGPARPPVGTGSLRFASGANPNALEGILQSRFDGARLADLTALAYSTFVERFGSGGQAPSLVLLVDWGTDGSVDDHLFFEPIDSGTVLLGSWQTWNALGGNWWSLKGIGGATSGSPKPLSGYVAALPGSRLVEAGLRVSAGCDGTSWAGFAGFVDALTIGVRGANTTYDFELAPTTAPPVPTVAPRPAASGKVTICHKGRVTITVGASATRAHLAHGDTLGACGHAQKQKGKTKKLRGRSAVPDAGSLRAGVSSA